MNITKFIFLLLISLSFEATANPYFGVLRGNKQIVYKSVFPGVLFLNMSQNGLISKDDTLYRIESYEYIAKLKSLKLKRNSEKQKQARVLKSLNAANNEIEKGFISRNELDEIKDKASDLSLYINELDSEIRNIELLLSMNSPEIKSEYIVRNVYANNGDYVKSGDNIIKIETLDSYHLDIKFDPSSINGNIKNKDIYVRSLVNDFSSKAIVSGIYTPENSGGVFGLKIASLRIISNANDLSELLDTTFEVIIND